MAGIDERIARLSEAEAARLAKLYTEAELEILREIDQATARGNDLRYLRGMLENVQGIIQDLLAGSRTWSEQAIPRLYIEGAKFAEGQLQKLGLGVAAGFGAIHQQAVKVLADNTYQRLSDAAQTIGRRVEDSYRHAALEVTRQSIIGHKTWQQVAQEYRDNLRAEGITSFTDAAGRKWNMKTYSEMVARTTTMEAHVTGTANRILEAGHDLVKVSDHERECAMCRPWEGRILSLTGKTPGYPTLAEAKSAGLFHPNCRHAIGMYLDLGDEKGEGVKQNISRDRIENFDKDFIDVPDRGKINLDKAPESQHKSIELVEEALAKAEKHASFQDVKILNMLRTEAGSPKTNAFVIPSEADDIIYLLASDVERFAQEAASRLKGVYQYYGLDPLAKRANEAADKVEYIKRTLLHELGHIEHKRKAGTNITESILLSLKEYVKEIFLAKAGMGEIAYQISTVELAEWIAEDFRLLKDPGSIYPHAHAYRNDLVDPESAIKRREKLKEALGW